ncbi:TetR family transcriptional regulator [Streptomyces sp. Je 1-4]|uniref:TetR/AcrR family transcriptional regulator n=1 Tax=Streptomyces TaxID=1883 RepID=UPI00140ECE71|nr:MULTISPECIES: TetR family transcriptional regulator [unclassified Streptomyces]QIK06850.1 TetR family transcriptional regulator [Streptomyces sp. ID38640]UYB40247.1 TetR family transcriptional regulator [Streptomyces sp. Je 1-4]UZQ36345.1 TetR family transcriptional regulator [Streptomyces sp. Je 1-4] [Streptomyces sp. Je 1-4 4N24]UZQ43763.1 TetR family transcriptional regulator [Streptomyces sp. Je 1-4] [Streptomyces sp. Je 1-4 4N24_ara]
MVSARTSATTPPGTPKIGLRERKKIQTRQAIRRAAYRLFEEQGYDATPIDQIAEAADVSPSTVFRYFPTKEDIVLTDEYDTALEAGLRARPADEPMVESMRRVTVEALREIAAADRGELVQRIRLIREVPAIRGRTAENTARDAALISAVLAERTGRPADDLELRVISAAILAALQEAMLNWVEGGESAELEALIDQTMDVLARGLTL